MKARNILYYGAPEKLERRNRLFVKLAVTAGVLAGYYVFVRLTGISIPCIFFEITGFKCPGCGVTHMFTSAARFEWKAAFMSNPLLFVLVPLFCIFMAIKLLFMPDWLEMKSKPYCAAEKVLLAVVLLFGVIRNIIGI